MKTHASLSELISGTRFISAAARSGSRKFTPEFYQLLDKAELSQHPKELEHYAQRIFELSKESDEVHIMVGALIRMATQHPMFARPADFIMDEHIQAYLLALHPTDLVTACRAADVLVDKENMRDSAEELSKLSVPQLIALMPEEDPRMFEDKTRLELFKQMVEYVVFHRHEQKINDFLNNALKESQRDDLMASIGVDIFDEDYEDSLLAEVVTDMIYEGVETFKSNVEWIDWTNWKPKDETLAVFEALTYTYEKITPELAAGFRADLKDDFV